MTYAIRGAIKTKPAEAGRKFKNEYQITIDENLHKSLVKTGETNTYAKIQAELEDTLIENILTRATLGDPEALNRREMMYLDTTDMPQSLAEAQNTIIRIETEFERLPLEERAKFDHSKEKYVALYGTDEWMSKKGIKMVQVPEAKEEPIIEPKQVEEVK